MTDSSRIREGTRRVTKIASVVFGVLGLFLGGSSYSGSDWMHLLTMAIVGAVAGYAIPVVVSKVGWYISDGFSSSGDNK